MRLWALNRHGCFSRLPLLVIVAAFLLNGQAFPADVSTEESIQPVPSEDYAIYDHIVQAKFLTSDTALVIVRRLTATHIGPEHIPFGRPFFDENRFFDGTLPEALLTNFLAGTVRPWRLESKFHFGVAYRFVSDFSGEIEEAGSAWPAVARPIEGGEPRMRLEFSRVAYASKEDLALVYVGQYRFDGTGAGFLVLLHVQPSGWGVQDTEVVWTMR